MKKKRTPTSMVDWCSLPTEIMEIIADLLLAPADRCRIRAVCKCWLSVVPTPTARPNTPPFLYIVPRNRILCLVENREYYLPHMQAKYDCQPFSSAHCLLGLVDLDRVFLFDPLSGDRLDLPPLWTLPDVKTVAFDRTNGVRTAFILEPDGYDLTTEELRDTFLIKLSASPASKTVIVYGDGKLASAKPSRKKWTPIKAPADYPFEFRFNDVVYHRADGKFYAIDCYGSTVSINAIHGNVKRVVATDVDYDRGHASEGPYLVSLPTGELLFVMILIQNPREIRRLQFVLGKLVVADEGRNGSVWELVERLDGWTIFVDATGSWARPAVDAVGYKGNCIYFSISHEYKWKGKMCRSVYNGICDTVEKNIQPMCCCSNLRKNDQPAAGLYGWKQKEYLHNCCQPY